MNFYHRNANLKIILKLYHHSKITIPDKRGITQQYKLMIKMLDHE